MTEVCKFCGGPRLGIPCAMANVYSSDKEWANADKKGILLCRKSVTEELPK